jgi:hypothetical protein
MCIAHRRFNIQGYQISKVCTGTYIYCRGVVGRGYPPLPKQMYLNSKYHGIYYITYLQPEQLYICMCLEGRHKACSTVYYKYTIFLYVLTYFEQNTATQGTSCEGEYFSKRFILSILEHHFKKSERL